METTYCRASQRSIDWYWGELDTNNSTITIDVGLTTDQWKQASLNIKLINNWKEISLKFNLLPKIFVVNIWQNANEFDDSGRITHNNFGICMQEVTSNVNMRGFTIRTGILSPYLASNQR